MKHMTHTKEKSVTSVTKQILNNLAVTFFDHLVLLSN